MNRRALLAACAALVPLPLAGCGRSTSPTETAPETPTPTPTPPEGFAGLAPADGCEPVALPEPDAATYPPFDGRVTDDADDARDFAGRFERALVDAHVRADARAEGNRVTENDVDLVAATVRAAGAGYVVRTHVSGAAIVREGTTPASGTLTPVPSVPYDVTASYYLTGRYAVRRGRESEVGALPEGAVACA